MRSALDWYRVRAALCPRGSGAGRRYLGFVREEAIPPLKLITRPAFRVLGLAAVLACEGGSRETVPPPGRVGDRDALLLASAKVALPPPADPAIDLPDPTSEGAQLVGRYCTACHAVPTPQIHSSTDWPRVARRMWLRIDGLPEGLPVPRPTGAERTMMLRYLIANALRVSGAALPVGPGRAEFAAVCSRCHELPDPRSHASEDWLAVVARMGERMDSMLGTALAANQQSDIVRYLAAASGASMSR